MKVSSDVLSTRERRGKEKGRRGGEGKKEYMCARSPRRGGS